MTLEDVGGRRDVLGCVARSSDQCAIPHNAHPAARVSDISLNYGDYINNPHHPWDERYISHEWLIFYGKCRYIWASIARYPPPPPTPWLWVCIVAPQYPPPPCGVGGVGGGGWWCTPLPPVVWVVWVVVGGGGGGGGRSCICMYMNVSVPPSPLWCGWCGWWWVVVVVVVEEVVYVCI